MRLTNLLQPPASGKPSIGKEQSTMTMNIFFFFTFFLLNGHCVVGSTQGKLLCYYFRLNFRIHKKKCTFSFCKSKRFTPLIYPAAAAHREQCTQRNGID